MRWDVNKRNFSKFSMTLYVTKLEANADSAAGAAARAAAAGVESKNGEPHRRDDNDSEEEDATDAVE
jgi:hypothetical protein